MTKLIQVKQTAVDTLIPFARNARTHSDEQVKQIAASIREFGFNNPILIRDDLTVIAGHGRLAAAKVLGLKEVPTISLAHLTPLQVRAYVLADNKIALKAGWDDEMLALELMELALEGYDAAITGFDELEIGALLADKIEEGLTDEDAVPEAPDDPKTKMGDVWLLGRHRVMCGDSTSIDTVAILMKEKKADLVFTDPPYGMSYSGGRGKHETLMDGNKRPAVLNDGLKGEELLTLLRDSLSAAKMFSKEGAAAYVCFPWRTYTEFHKSFEDAGFKVNACIVWDKKSIGLGKGNFRPQHEFIFYSQGESWFGGLGESDVWYMSRGNTSAYVHPTQKPIELIERAINNSSKAGDVVIDCFGGSGSTVIASERTGRTAYLIDLEPKYCDVIVKRWQDFTGKKATLESNGKTFDELEAI